jgi:hypothetical protein
LKIWRKVILEHSSDVKRSLILILTDDVDVLEYFGRTFEVVYGILHPFEQVAPENRGIIDETWALQDNRSYYLGTNLEFMAYGDGPTWSHYQTLIHPFPWREVVRIMGFPSLNYLNRLLLECCVARRRDHGEDIDRMFEMMQTLGLDPPNEGLFPPLLLEKFLRSFLDIGNEMVQITGQWGDWTQNFEVESLLNQKLISLWSVSQRNESGITLHSPDYRMLYGGHWDSMYTFLCGRKYDVRAVVEKYQFEGFWFQPGMRLYWEDSTVLIP